LNIFLIGFDEFCGPATDGDRNLAQGGGFGRVAHADQLPGGTPCRLAQLFDIRFPIVHGPIVAQQPAGMNEPLRLDLGDVESHRVIPRLVLHVNIMHIRREFELKLLR